MIKLNAFEVGSFKNYNLKYFEKKEMKIRVEDGFLLVLHISSGMKGARCVSRACKVEGVNETHIEVWFNEVMNGEWLNRFLNVVSGDSRYIFQVS